jgi:hypothetical protein
MDGGNLSDRGFKPAQRADIGVNGFLGRATREAIYADVVDRIQSPMAARAAAYSDGLGGETGLPVGRQRSLLVGRKRIKIFDYSFHAAVLQELATISIHRKDR